MHAIDSFCATVRSRMVAFLSQGAGTSVRSAL